MIVNDPTDIIDLPVITIDPNPGPDPDRKTVTAAGTVTDRDQETGTGTDTEIPTVTTAGNAPETMTRMTGVTASLGERTRLERTAS